MAGLSMTAGPVGSVPEALVAAVQRVARREGLFPRGCAALIMVSGGQDSLALLHLLATGGLGKAGPSKLHVLHVNHHLRGEESDADQSLVEAVCGRLGVELTVVHRPVPKRGNVQEVAREARRQAAIATAEELGMSRIVLGHTADDQVETMLYRLGRYGGLAAFRGMLVLDPPWVRPLLECRRAQTAAYCQAVGLTYADDRGNRYPGYARTALREQVLPAWEAALPGAVRGAARAAEVAAEIERLTRRLISDCWGAVEGRPLEGAEGLARQAARGQGESAGPDVLRVSALRELDSSLLRLVLHAWVEGRARPAASRASVLAVEELLRVNGSASRDLGGGWRAQKVYDLLWLERSRRGSGARAGCQAPGPDLGGNRQDEVEPPVSLPSRPPVSLPSRSPVSLRIPGSVFWGGRRVCASVIPVPEPERYQHPDVEREAFVDVRCLTGEVVVRGPLPGDRLRPLGASGSRKLQDLLVDRKVPREDRQHVPLVVAGGRIVWVGGLAVAEEGRITGDTKEVVWLRMGENERLNGET